MECHAIVSHRHVDLNTEYRARSDECRGAKRGSATGQRVRNSNDRHIHIRLLHSFILPHSLLEIRYSSAVQQNLHKLFREIYQLTLSLSPTLPPTTPPRMGILLAAATRGRGDFFAKMSWV